MDDRAAPQVEGGAVWELYDELIEVLQVERSLLGERRDRLVRAAGSGSDDARFLGRQVERLRARRDFWARLGPRSERDPR